MRSWDGARATQPFRVAPSRLTSRVYRCTGSNLSQIGSCISSYMASNRDLQIGLGSTDTKAILSCDGHITAKNCGLAVLKNFLILTQYNSANEPKILNHLSYLYSVGHEFFTGS